MLWPHPKSVPFQMPETKLHNFPHPNSLTSSFVDWYSITFGILMTSYLHFKFNRALHITNQDPISLSHYTNKSFSSFVGHTCEWSKSHNHVTYTKINYLSIYLNKYYGMRLTEKLITSILGIIKLQKENHTRGIRFEPTCFMSSIVISTVNNERAPIPQTNKKRSTFCIISYTQWREMSICSTVMTCSYSRRCTWWVWFSRKERFLNWKKPLATWNDPDGWKTKNFIKNMTSSSRVQYFFENLLVYEVQPKFNAIIW